MEQARLFIAIALSFLVFFLWEVFFAEKPSIQEPEKPQMSQAEPVKKEEPVPVPGSEPVIGTPGTETSPGTVSPTGTDRAPRTIIVNSQKYTVKISEKGAVFKSFVLREYREKAEPDSPPREMIPQEVRTGTVVTNLTGNSISGLKDAVYSANIEADATDVMNGPKTISFSYTYADGIVFEKQFTFSPDTYLISLKVIIKNKTLSPVQDNLSVGLARTVPGANAAAYGFEGPSAYIGNSLEQIAIKKIKEKDTYTGEVKWIAVEDRYFISGLIPSAPDNATMHISMKNELLESALIHPFTLAPGTQHESGFTLFLGPKSLKLLRKLDTGLEKAIYFGWFDFIAKPCLWLMNFLHDLIPNYGVAIIILTLLVKGILWPLGNKGYKSMNEMKKIQPLMADIREKYKDDKARMNQEIMNLYKTYKINPVGGCLPMILQIPVFFALYRMLYEAIELRHAPFFGWINDLSAPDRLFHFSFSIPFMEPPFGIPVLTIIMGATMFIQQKMSPPPGDPAQAKMMMMMPVVFTFIFINFSSGLVLYWLVNNVLSIAQQYYISKR